MPLRGQMNRVGLLGGALGAEATELIETIRVAPPLVDRLSFAVEASDLQVTGASVFDST